ncbi:ATP-binding cassette domain-containing protein [Pseudohoeflea coraliihabitans]|uniref:ATP-binding cassette domain-containing protein n=1 Tax=Pseudohoeflea coraliihabitans TaxID=2860393 RepID=A0ABS6WJ94_9HYPH|nr:ATP-binding cassette domain-containing protein [Pseudohoeflea sp. DP4N28-3]MBW3096017.1 ATP-binding cassette domain-containing protein [Pseudohoeflea sp. DP4N28-3]
MTPALECHNIRSGYGDMEIIAGIDLKLDVGDIYAIVGKNGAGKTTLVKTIMRVLPLLGGSFTLFGNDAAKLSTNQVVSLGIASSPQDRPFFNDLSVEENLRLGALGQSRQQFRGEIDRIVEMFPFIGQRLAQKVGTLSGGEQAMVKVGRALLPKPRLVILDEVTEGLQPMIVDRVREVLLRDHKERSITILVVEQNVDFVAGLASRYGLIERGCMVAEGRFSDSGARKRITDHLLV